MRKEGGGEEGEERSEYLEAFDEGKGIDLDVVFRVEMN